MSRAWGNGVNRRDIRAPQRLNKYMLTFIYTVFLSLISLTISRKISLMPSPLRAEHST